MLDKRPSLCSDRKEVLTVSEYRADMKHRAKLFVFEHKHNKIVFVDEFEPDKNGINSSFNFYMEEGAYEEKIGQIKKGVY